jgi:hypothetical protein
VGFTGAKKALKKRANKQQKKLNDLLSVLQDRVTSPSGMFQAEWDSAVKRTRNQPGIDDLSQTGGGNTSSKVKNSRATKTANSWNKRTAADVRELENAPLEEGG